MYTISTEKSGNGYIWKCSCGRVGNAYPTEEKAWEIGDAHVTYMH
jgi:hypothetical protein